MDQLDAMRTLVHVVAESSFAAAGRRRGLPRAVVSKQIAWLETELGARFFHRTTRRLSLTDAGARFHRHAVQILAAVETAHADVDERRGPRGLIRMTAPAAFSELHLMSHLESFARMYPDVEIELDCSERFVDLVDEGFDVGIRICVSPPAGVVARKLAPSSLVVCGSPRYFEEHGTPQRIEELARHRCLGYALQARGTEWDLGGTRVGITPSHRTNDNRFLRHLALHGHGLAQLPAYLVADDLGSGRLLAVLERHRDRSRSVFVVYPNRAGLAAKVRVLVDHLVSALATNRSWR